MRRFIFALVFASTLAAPAAARAGFILEASVGKGAQLSPDLQAEQVNIMLAPGVTILSLLRLELGFVNNLPDTENGKYNLELRPMVVVAPPLLPLYGRLIFAFTNLLGRDELEREIAYGAALGIKLGLGPIGVFAEAGLLPRSREINMKDEMSWVLEGRLGAYLSF